MTIFATVGYPGSGKGEASTVAARAGLPVVSMGDVIRRACRARCLPVTEDTLGQVATALRDVEGDDAIAVRTLALLRPTHRAYGDVLVDGIRGAAEVERFRADLGDDFHLVAIEAPFEVRLERVRTRGRDPTAEQARDLERRDRRERGYGMDEAIAAADRTIENVDTLEAFHDELETVLTRSIQA